jgi:magnesium-transporting ATPase (P-type)
MPVLPVLDDPSLLDAADVATRLEVDPAKGLSSQEAERRLALEGPNELAGAPPVPPWRRLLEQLRDPLVYLLMIAAVVSLAAWVIEGSEGWPFDAVVIGLIVVLNAALGYVQEARAERAVAALRDLTTATATVLRDGELTRVPSAGVVRGDVLLLSEGDTVVADGRLVEATSLQVAEASLTGESAPVLKNVRALPEPAPVGDRLSMVFSGTAVTRGAGRAVVTTTGMATQVGEVATLLESTVDDPTPLETEITRVGRMLGVAVVAIAVVVVATILLTSDVRSVQGLVSVLLLGVSLAVAAVPEGLPAVLTTVLALGVQRMARSNAIVTRLSSVETLGSASVICCDKTGTLTKNEMTIMRVVTASGEVVLTGTGYRPEGRAELDGVPLDEAGPDAAALREELTAVLTGGSLANNAVLRVQDGEWHVQGDPTEASFLVAERKLGLHGERLERFSRVGQIPFTSERKLMSTIEKDSLEAGRVLVVTKGAPDVLLPRCTHERVGADVVPLDTARRARLLGEVDRLSERALRTLGVAYRTLGVSEAPEADESIERDLVLAGLVGILDPARPEAAVAIGDAQRAGIRLIMITGDHPLTAQRIAGDLGLAPKGAAVLTGLQLEDLDDAAFARAVREVSVYARVAPKHKLRIVDALQADGGVVAMTGDGVNDAPALKSADIGVAMGTGTDVTKESAKMILADDNFATIVQAVREGRGIFDNIRKFLRYLLSSNMGEVLTVFFGVVGAGVIGLSEPGTGEGVVLPLLATQILWINLLTDTGPALAMGVDPETEDVMARPPRPPGQRVIDSSMWANVVFTGVVTAVLTLLTIDLYLPGGLLSGSLDLETARTAGFTVLVLAQLFNCVNARSGTVSAFRHLFVNRWLWGAMGLSTALHVLVVQVPVLNEAFGTRPLALGQWLGCAAIASGVLWASEARKFLLRSRAALSTQSP